MTPKFAGTAGLAARQGTNHRTPGAVREGVKGEIEIRSVMHSQRTIY